MNPLSLLLAVVPLLASPGAPAERSPLWGNLEPGPHEVGFRLLEVLDRSRAPAATPIRAGAPGRPIRVWIWYPANPTAAYATMPFARYAALVDEDFWPAATGSDRRGDFARGPLARSLSGEELEALLLTPTGAVEEAPIAAGSHPLVVVGQGLYYESPIAHAILAEYLASHGHVVATCPLIGTGSRLVNLDVVDLETQIRDLEVVIVRARELPGVSEERLGLLGFDMGGMACVTLAMRNPDVDAFVSLDAGILYGHPSDLPGASPHYDRERLRIPWLHATRSAAVVTPGAPGSLFDTAVHAERFLILVDGAQHCDFNSFAMIEGRSPVLAYWGPIGADARPRYEAVCRYVSSFLGAFLRGDDSGRNFLAGDPQDTAPGVPLTVDHRASRPAPPSIDDLVNAIAARGVEAAANTIRDLAATAPDHELAREAILNRLGYQYLYFWGDGEVAIALLRLAIELYPESANAHDSLGEAYLLAGENELAAVNYRRSLELDPGNENARAALRRLEGR